jgi:hypothetical protein
MRGDVEGKGGMRYRVEIRQKPQLAQKEREGLE